MIIFNTGDCHLDCSTNDLGYMFYKNFNILIEDVIDAAKTGRKTVLVLGGDIFDNDNPSIASINFMINKLSILNKYNVIKIGFFGNHDKINPIEGISPVEVLNSAGLFELYTSIGPNALLVDGVNFVIQPWMYDTSLMKSKMSECAEKYSGDAKLNMMFSHFPLKNAWPLKNEYPAIEDLPTQLFDYIGLSDLHSLLENNRFISGKCEIQYTRAICHTKVSDMIKCPPGYVKIVVNDDYTFDAIPIELPQPEIIYIKDEKSFLDNKEKINSSVVILENLDFLALVNKEDPLVLKEKIEEEEEKELFIEDSEDELSNIENKNVSFLDIKDELVELLDYNIATKSIVKSTMNKNNSSMKEKDMINDLYQEIESKFTKEVCDGIIANASTEELQNTQES